MNRFNELYNTIKERIIEEEYPPNSKISEAVLSKEFQCSRTPIRQVLQKLSDESLVHIVPKSGTYIRNPSLKNLVDFIQVRSYIEALAFRLCIESSLPINELTEKLELLCDDMHTSLSSLTQDGMKQFVRLHYSFHESIVLFSENRLLIKFFKELNLIKRYSFVKSMTLSDIVRTEEEHRKIVEYIRNRDPTGEYFVIQHLYNKINRYTLQ